MNPIVADFGALDSRCTASPEIFSGPLKISFSWAPANPESVQGILDALDSVRKYVADRAADMLAGDHA